jgi:hypothetical protein
MGFLISIPMALTVAAPAASQDVREHDVGARSKAFHVGLPRTVKSYEGSADARDIVRTIMNGIGLPMNFDVRSAPEIANAQALVE